MILLLGSAEAGAQASGWRGDGSGNFPDPNPPTSWSKTPDGKTVGVVWQNRLPHYSFSSPLVIGDRVILRSEPYDLICLDARTGRLIWVRTHGPDEIVPPQLRGTSPQWPEIVATKAKLDETNQAIYSSGEPAADLIKQKREIQKHLGELTAQIDRQYRIAPEMWRSKWSGYTGSTPFFDGKNIYFTSNMGVIGCVDLDGNRKWMIGEPVNSNRMGEHGCGSSPMVVGERLIYCVANDVVAVNKAKSKGSGVESQSTLRFDSRPLIRPPKRRRSWRRKPSPDMKGRVLTRR